MPGIANLCSSSDFSFFSISDLFSDSLLEYSCIFAKQYGQTSALVVSYQHDSCLCQQKRLEIYTSDYMVASSSDFIMYLAKLNVLLKASALLMKCELEL